MTGPPLLVRVFPAGGGAYDTSLEEGQLVVGRSPRSGLHIPDPLLSREHARLCCETDGWWVQDLESHNGTFLNGQRLSGAARLSPGDVLVLGASRIAVRHPGWDRETEPSSGSVLRPAAELLGRRLAPPGPDEVEELRRHAEDLRVLIDVHQALSRPIALAELLELILDRAFAHIGPEEAGVFLTGPAGELACVASRSAHGAGHRPLCSTHLQHEVVEKGMAALVTDLATDERFAEAASLLRAGVRTLLAAPLLDPEGSLGMIVLGSGKGSRMFTPDDLELLVCLASAAALRIRNVGLAEEAADRRWMAEEMARARSIQEGLLPGALPALDGWELCAVNRPSAVVSGDFYAVLPRGDPNDLALLICDVAGKGMPASLVAASLEALFAGPLEAGFAPHEVFAKVTSRLLRRTPPEKFATAFLGVLDPASGRLRFANAGHLPGLVIDRDGGHRWLRASGIPLGLLPLAQYEPGVTSLALGDLLVLYTDGFTEALSPSGEELGREGVLDVCRRAANLPLPDIVTALEGAVTAFTGGAAASDDRTLVLLRRQRYGLQAPNPGHASPKATVRYRRSRWTWCPCSSVARVRNRVARPGSVVALARLM